MNTRIIYDAKIKVAVSGTSVGYVVRTKIDEEGYKRLLDQIETRKFITVIDTSQNPVTIKVDTICKIDVNITLDSDADVKEEE